MKPDPELLKFYNGWAKKIEAIIQGQAPVKTGKLKSSVQVKFVPSAKGLGGRFLISADATNGQSAFKYGMAFQYGTLDYYTKSVKGKQPIPPSGPKNQRTRPGAGKEGIKPLYWMNLSDTVDQMLMDEVAQATKKFAGELVRKEIKKEKITI